MFYKYSYIKPCKLLKLITLWFVLKLLIEILYCCRDNEKQFILVHESPAMHRRNVEMVKSIKIVNEAHKNSKWCTYTLENGNGIK